MNRYLVPFKREFWEYRGSFIRLPAISVIVISVLMAAALAVYASNIFDIAFNNDNFHIGHEKVTDEEIRFDINVNESTHHREALVAARADLIEARDEVSQHKNSLKEHNIAQKGISKAEIELKSIGIDLKLQAAGVDDAEIRSEIQRQLDLEIEKLDKEIHKIDAELVGAIDAEVPAAPKAPTNPDAQNHGEEIRQFPSQVIVIEGSEAKGFTDDNISSIDEVIKIFFSLFSVLMMVVGVFYLLSCLYTDRKDNSILFWKSMPISETQNVLTKVSTGVLLLSSIAVLSGLLVSIVFTMLSMIYVANYSASTTAWELWSGVSLFSYAIKHWFTALGVGLWCLPTFAWLAFASAAARRSPFMLAILPPAVLATAEQIVFDSNWILNIITSRLPGVSIQDNGNAGFLMFEKAGLSDIGNFIASPGLWIGLAVAGGLLYATIWVRNNKYEI